MINQSINRSVVGWMSKQSRSGGLVMGVDVIARVLCQSNKASELGLRRGLVSVEDERKPRIQAGKVGYDTSGWLVTKGLPWCTAGRSVRHCRLGVVWSSRVPNPRPGLPPTSSDGHTHHALGSASNCFFSLESETSGCLVLSLHTCISL